MFKRIIYISFILITIASCDFSRVKSTEVKENPLAKVYDNFLYSSDIVDVLPSNISNQDSILFVKSYVDSWAKKQLLLHQAELNLENEASSFDKLVSEYRSTLFINSYKEALVLNKLDTLITEHQIEKYYLANNNNFKLNEELVQLKYIHTSKNRTDKKGLVKLFKSKEEEDIDSLQLRSLEFKSFNFNDSIWIKYTDLLEKILYLNKVNKKQLLKKSNFIEKEDSLGLYLITVNNVLKRNDIAPISYVKPTIKQIILHKRKLELLRKIEVELLNDAIKNKKFERY
ncbi:MAG: hypothetical protein ACI8RP_000270 [Urechidicola sp.]|jgi:hypothetical protein|tara:strand:- start:182 stop:1039 length:858 start_codon:yes stop_codon:yes gene_type:complete